MSVFFKVHYSCSRVAWFHFSEIFVGFKEAALLSSPEFPLLLLSDSSTVITFYGQPLEGTLICHLLDLKVLISDGLYPLLHLSFIAALLPLEMRCTVWEGLGVRSRK